MQPRGFEDTKGVRKTSPDLRGPAYIRTLLDGLRDRLEEKGYGSVGQMKGILSQRNCPDPQAFERADSVKSIANSTPFRDEASQ